MQIQSLSIVVPVINGKCMNHCASCPSRMHDSPYPVLMDESVPGFENTVNEYIKRLEFARHNGCNTVMLTGSTEPQQNRKFLAYFGMMQKMMKDPFQWVEMQTTCAGIDRNYIRFLRNHVGVNLISMSVFALDNQKNAAIIHPPKGMEPAIWEMAKIIKEEGCSLRMSLNMTSFFNSYADDPEKLFKQLHDEFGADQVTLRILYESGQNLPEDIWVRKNSATMETVQAFRNYIRDNGKILGTLSYGAKKYGVYGMSTVMDDDSMGKSVERRFSQTENYKYLILRENAKLYSEWDDPASLIF